MRLSGGVPRNDRIGPSFCAVIEFQWMKSKIDSILVNELCLRYKPNLIVLFGSEARGDSDAGSDLDFMVVSSGKSFIQDSFLWKNRFIDVLVYPKSFIQKCVKGKKGPEIAIRSELRRVQNPVYVWGDKKMGQSIVALAKKINRYSHTTSREEKNFSKLLLVKHLERAANDSIESKFRSYQFVATILNCYFQLNDSVSFGPKQDLRRLKKLDPELYSLMENFLLRSKIDLSSLALCVQKIIEIP
jgi:predicted nucleotidyltransferase